MKSIDEIKRALSKISIVDLNRDDAYSAIEKVIKNDLVQLAFPGRIFEKGLKLHRCCNNYEDKDFQNIDRLSFRTDLNNIWDYQVTFF